MQVVGLAPGSVSNGFRTVPRTREKNGAGTGVVFRIASAPRIVSERRLGDHLEGTEAEGIRNRIPKKQNEDSEIYTDLEIPKIEGWPMLSWHTGSLYRTTVAATEESRGWRYS